MSSFEERQALAAKRSAELQSKQAAERAERVRQEAERKQKAEIEARDRAQRERDRLVAKERRKKEESEARKREEEQRRERIERAKQQREERTRLSNDDDGGGADRRRELKRFSQRALQSAGASTSLSSPEKGREKGASSPGRGGGRRNGINEDDGFLSSHGPVGSTLTREERRARQRMSLFDGEGRKGKRATSKRKQTMGLTDKRDDLVALGTVKRDQRSIDEIERDLHEAKRQKAFAALASSSSTSSMRAAEASWHEHLVECELDVGARRAKAADEKARLNAGPRSGSFTGKPPPPSSSASIPSSHLSKNRLGLTPADYLPGAKIRSDLAVVADKRPTAKGMGTKPLKSTGKSAADPRPASKRKETARDRFLREEQERKQDRLKLQAGSQRYEEDDEDSDEEEEGDDDDDDGDDGESEEEAFGRTKKRKKDDFREEIWKLFGRQRSDYVNRIDDESDDDDDMEADMESVRREEAQSLRLARLEDEREERDLRRHEQAKAARKAARK